ncbi:MAG: alkyl hydroperoxide reductase [Micavibrio aeruginosavorus]|uniref:Alkyl hydroperoxide reductase AhpD n=1 Tax=Micavibrio aeruginosavorus TaxID=349221 RepID=A0A2W5A391_9BACT|nr:MAG: alkyl hydroperoxide reductase [Micavibrio aeruginosavorus]
MSLENIKNAIPDYAKDIKLNISALANEEVLSAQQFWGCMVACALTGGNDIVIRNVVSEASAQLSAEALNAAKAAASIMAMNNVYYKFVGMSANAEYKTMPAKLRMNVIGNPGVDKGDFELWSLAVSAMNGCKFCVDAHEGQLKAHNIDSAMVQTAVRVASVMAAASAVLTGEAAMSGMMPMAQAA